ncbi:phage portal protein [uncultured Corynebacterium sp.]|uniref:phage portal protein n=1 Tax=uncultured Corynebacterium sp. TaxID=159447 RepID=UPI002599C345|nr:phage portal protein [uncultured Corynebacterium sp.]
MTVPVVMSSGLTEDEARLIGRLQSDLVKHRKKNAEKWKYYDGEVALKNMEIAIPSNMVSVEASIGWGGVIVDALDERIDWLGWTADDRQADMLQSVARENRLSTEFNKVKLDSLVTGVGFLEVTAGGAGEPDVIINAVSSSDATYLWDERANRVSSGLVMKQGSEGEDLVTLYLPDMTVTVVRERGESRVIRHVHNRGRCGLVAFPNKSRAGLVRGQSELTKPVRYAIDHAQRTILEMEYNREIYTTPQKWFANILPEDLGFDPESEADMSEFDRIKKGFDVAMTRAVILPTQEEDGKNPTTGQYQSAPPTPYIDELQMITQLLSSYSGIPSSWFGFHTDNPPSAEGQRALEARNVKMSERRCTSYSGPMDADVAFIAQSILAQRYEEAEEPTPPFMATISSRWRDPATPTVSAATDAVTKQIEAGALPRNSVVALERMGYSDADIRRVQQEWSQESFRQILAMASKRELPEDPLADELARQRVE